MTQGDNKCTTNRQSLLCAVISIAIEKVSCYARILWERASERTAARLNSLSEQVNEVCSTGKTGCLVYSIT